MLRKFLLKTTTTLGVLLFSLGCIAHAITANDKVAAELFQIRTETEFPEAVAKKFEAMKAPLKAVIDGGDINAVDAEGKTALMHTVAAGDIEFIAYLLFKNADTTIKDKAGKTAADYTNNDDIKDLLAADTLHGKTLSDSEKAEIRKKYEKDWSGTYLGVNKDCDKLIKIVQAGWKNTDTKGNDVIHSLIAGHTLRNITQLITMMKAGADINRCCYFAPWGLTSGDQTPLITAVSYMTRNYKEEQVAILLLGGADPNILGTPIEHNTLKTTPLCVPFRRSVGSIHPNQDRLFIAAGAAKSYLQGMQEVVFSRTGDRCTPSTKELFLRVLNEALGKRKPTTNEAKTIRMAADRYKDPGLIKDLEKRQILSSSGEGDVDAAWLASNVIRKASGQNNPDAHAEAKKLVKAKKWTEHKSVNFLLAVTAENPAEIKRTAKELGSISDFIRNQCLPTQRGSWVVHPTHSSPFSLIRSVKIAKLVLSLEKNLVPVRVNWSCMTPQLLNVYLKAKLDMNAPKSDLDENARIQSGMKAEKDYIEWSLMTPEMLELLKPHGVEAPEDFLDNHLGDMSYDTLQAFIEGGFKPGKEALGSVIYSDISPARKIDLLVKHGADPLAKDYIDKVHAKPEVVKALVRAGAKKDEALKNIQSKINTIENGPVASTPDGSNKYSDYKTLVMVRDILEGKISTDPAPEAETEPKSETADDNEEADGESEKKSKKSKKSKKKKGDKKGKKKKKTAKKK